MAFAAPNGEALDSVSAAKLSDSVIAVTDSAKKRSDLNDTVRYEAEIIEYDMEAKKLFLSRDAVIRFQNITLHADTIVYTINDDLFTATGSPQLVEGGDTTVGEALVYNIRTRRGTVRYASSRMDGDYFNSKRIVKTADNVFYAEHADFTSCIHVEDPHYCFYTKDVKVIPNDKAIARPAIFNIGDVPVAALPYFILPLERKRRSGFLTPSFGGQPASGGYLDNVGYYFAINDYLDFTASSRIQEFQNFVISGASNYALKYWFSGNLRGRLSWDGAFTGNTLNAALDYSHRQNLSPDGTFTLAGAGSLVTTRDFFSLHSQDTTELLNQVANANLSLSKRFPQINASANLVWNRTHNLQSGRIGEDLPALSFSLPTRALFPMSTESRDEAEPSQNEPKWYNNITVSYDAQAKQRRSVVPEDDVNSFIRKGMSQNLSLNAPQKLLKYITFNPYFNARASVFDSYQDTAATQIIPADTTTDTLIGRRRYFGAGQPRLLETRVREVFQPDSTIKYDTLYLVEKIKPAQYIYPTHNDLGYTYSWNTGVSLQTNLYGTFPVQLFNITGIRHTLTPSITYRYTPAYEQDKRFHDIGIPYDRGRLNPSQAITFSLGNQFQGKRTLADAKDGQKAREEKFQILNANLSTTYDFEAKPQRWSDLLLSASTAYKIMHVSFNSAFWLGDTTGDMYAFPQLRNYSITLQPAGGLAASGSLWSGELADLEVGPLSDPSAAPKSGGQWRFSLSPSYTFSQSRPSISEPFVTNKRYNLSASASLDFSKKWSVSWNGTYDFVTNKMVGHNLDFSCDLECWSMRFNWRPSGYYPGYSFLINIKKIPEIKWEKKN